MPPREKILKSKPLVCKAIGCECLRPDTRPFCDRCYGLVESDTKRTLERFFRPLRKPTRPYLLALNYAIGEILHARTSGRRVPRVQEFEW